MELLSEVNLTCGDLFGKECYLDLRSTRQFILVITERVKFSVRTVKVLPEGADSVIQHQFE